MLEENAQAAGRSRGTLENSATASNDLKSNFGRRGWTMIVFSGLLFWINTGTTVDGLNVILGALSSTFKLDYNSMLAWATPATLFSIPAAPVFAWISQKYGAKIAILIGLAITAVCFGFLGVWGTMLGFFVLFSAVCFCATGYAHIGGNAMIASWFPRKKGLALGWSTMGQNFSTALFVPVMAWFLSSLGTEHAFWGISAIILVLMLLIGSFARNTPEEAGVAPDNDPMTAEQIVESARQHREYVCPFSTRQMLAMKDVWLVGFAYGALYMVTVGLVSQLVPRLMAIGYDLNTAISYLTIAALVGVIGSYAWGWLDQKIGTRNASLVYSFWYIAALILNVFELNEITLWISVFMIGFGIGGCGNLATSIVATKFHRGTFIKAWGIINPIQSIVRSFAFAVLAFGLTYLGGYSGAYSIYIVINLIAAIMIWRLDNKKIG
ncbi:MFS transporter [uncultured Cohaesibacter sp.]|uniref:MFS transporter n=1 Tax=uncultured Cohaesibacter sp. TaxID=1002546 RepID=UPI002931340F|nr:MFS transporter [uncultured Cohaesibacter sp.]